MQAGAAPVGSSMEIPQKIKNGSAFDPVIPLLGIYPKEPKALIWKNISTPNFIAAYLVYHCQDMEAAQVSISIWVDKTNMGHLHNGTVHTSKKEGILTFCDSMDETGDYNAKQKQEKMISLTSGN